jgi:tyrosyl-tRNA synthetase
VERYLKLFTFLPIESIALVMVQHRVDASKRSAQHLLAKEVVELAHGAQAAKEAETAHKQAFGHGTNVYSLYALRNALRQTEGQKAKSDRVFDHSKHPAESAGRQQASVTDSKDAPKADAAADIVVLPSALLQQGTFPQVLYAAGLVSSKSEAHRLIKNKGAYVVLPNSGTVDNPYDLKWDNIPSSIQEADPNHYLVDYEALVLRSGKTKIQICHIIDTENFEAGGLFCPGWEDFKAKQATAPKS